MFDVKTGFFIPTSTPLLPTLKWPEGWDVWTLDNTPLDKARHGEKSAPIMATRYN